MEIKRPSHICAGAVFEFAAIFWNLFEKFLQKILQFQNIVLILRCTNTLIHYDSF